MTWSVYALCEPATGEIRYVGMSKHPARRLAWHYDNPSSDKMKGWLSGLVSPPVVRVLSSHESQILAAAEERKVIGALSIGGRLLNVAHIQRPRVEKRQEFTGLGERLKACCKTKGITITELSRRTGVCQPSLSDLANGVRHSFHASSAVLVARALGTTVEYLVTGESP